MVLSGEFQYKLKRLVSGPRQEVDSQLEAERLDILLLLLTKGVEADVVKSIKLRFTVKINADATIPDSQEPVADENFNLNVACSAQRSSRQIC